MCPSLITVTLSTGPLQIPPKTHKQIPSLPLLAFTEFTNIPNKIFANCLLSIGWFPINSEGKDHGYLVTTGSCD